MKELTIRQAIDTLRLCANTAQPDQEIRMEATADTLEAAYSRDLYRACPKRIIESFDCLQEALQTIPEEITDCFEDRVMVRVFRAKVPNSPDLDTLTFNVTLDEVKMGHITVKVKKEELDYAVDHGALDEDQVIYE